MLSLETAKKLKDAGMQWEPNYADLYQLIIERIENIYCYDESILACLEINRYNPTWIPRFDQMLAEIEKREYAWEMMRGVIEVWHRYLPTGCKKFVTETTDEAAAQALIWILGQEEKA